MQLYGIHKENRKFHKRITLLFMTALMCVLLLSGCGRASVSKTFAADDKISNSAANITEESAGVTKESAEPTDDESEDEQETASVTETGDTAETADGPEIEDSSEPEPGQETGSISESEPDSDLTDVSETASGTKIADLSAEDGLEDFGNDAVPSIDENGSYTSKDDVALYIHTYNRLPGNFVTKKEAEKLGWPGGGLDDYIYGGCIGGSYFGNYEGALPETDGREYHECDIDTMHKSKRGSKRIVYSNDGLIYYTPDHYETFELLYGEEQDA